VSSTLKLENIKENNVNLWLADTLALVVKNIQRTHMSVLQGIVVMFWVIHYMSLVIGKDYELINNELLVWLVSGPSTQRFKIGPCKSINIGFVKIP